MRFPIEHEIGPLQVLALENEMIQLHFINCDCMACREQQQREKAAREHGN